jgi:hypothetical protein
MKKIDRIIKYILLSRFIVISFSLLIITLQCNSQTNNLVLNPSF